LVNVFLAIKLNKYTPVYNDDKLILLFAL